VDTVVAAVGFFFFHVLGLGADGGDASESYTVSLQVFAM
jgi:hypothetical protein